MFPLSKLKRGLAEVLKREGYIWDWQEVEGDPVSQLRLELKYGANGEARDPAHQARQQARPPRVSQGQRNAARARRHGHHDHQHQPAAFSATAKPGRRTSAAKCCARFTSHQH